MGFWGPINFFAPYAPYIAPMNLIHSLNVYKAPLKFIISYENHSSNSFLRFYVMSSPQIDLYGIAHVKVDIIPLQKMYVIPMLGRFVWTTNFVECADLSFETGSPVRGRNLAI